MNSNFFARVDDYARFLELKLAKARALCDQTKTELSLLAATGRRRLVCIELSPKQMLVFRKGEAQL